MKRETADRIAPFVTSLIRQDVNGETHFIACSNSKMNEVHIASYFEICDIVEGYVEEEKPL